MAINGKSGFADGIRTEQPDNLGGGAGWVGHGYHGAHVFSPNDGRIELIRLPEIGSSVSFGGARCNVLFVMASQSLCAVPVELRGGHFC